MNFITALAWIAVILGGCVWAIGLLSAAYSAFKGRWVTVLGSLYFPICVSLFPMLGAVWLWVTRGG